MRTTFLAAAALAALTLASACKKKTDDNPNPTQQLTGELSAANSVPANPSPGTGTVTGTYDPTTQTLNYTLTFSDLTGPPTIAHFHYGNSKHIGPTFVTFKDLPTSNSGTIKGSAMLTAAQIDSFRVGRVYANIHTAKYGAGEIRANVVVK